MTFNLSDKIDSVDFYKNGLPCGFSIEDVREFIRLLKEDIDKRIKIHSEYAEKVENENVKDLHYQLCAQLKTIKKDIDYRAGSKLIDSPQALKKKVAPDKRSLGVSPTPADTSTDARQPSTSEMIDTVLGVEKGEADVCDNCGHSSVVHEGIAVNDFQRKQKGKCMNCKCEKFKPKQIGILELAKRIKDEDRELIILGFIVGFKLRKAPPELPQ